MTKAYDKYYQTENLFGKPYPELLEFFNKYPTKGKVLDLGCGQGRDAIPLACLGFSVTGIDSSKVGIEQMNQIAENENLKLKGVVADIFNYVDFDGYNFVLLDSMFHFEKKDRLKETEFIQKILSKSDKGCFVVFCIQDTGKKVEILNNCFDTKVKVEQIADEKFIYTYEDGEHKSETNYRIIVVRKSL